MNNLKMAQIQTGDDLGDQPVEIGIRWPLDVQVSATNVVQCLVVLESNEE